jgi:hypothetical protein
VFSGVGLVISPHSPTRNCGEKGNVWYIYASYTYNYNGVGRKKKRQPNLLAGKVLGVQKIKIKI